MDATKCNLNLNTFIVGVVWLFNKTSEIIGKSKICDFLSTDGPFVPLEVEFCTLRRIALVEI